MRASCKHLLSKKLTNQDRSALIGSPLAESGCQLLQRYVSYCKRSKSEQQRQPMSQLLF